MEKQNQMKVLKIAVCSLGLTAMACVVSINQTPIIPVVQAQTLETETKVIEEIIEPKVAISPITQREISKNKILSAKGNIDNERAYRIMAQIKGQDRKFSKLKSDKLLADKEFQHRYAKSSYTALDVRKVIYDMQTLSSHISNKYKVSPAISEDIVYNTYIEAHKVKISPLLVLSLMSTESSFNPSATSYVGAKGLMQVMPDIHKDKIAKTKANLNKINDNIRVGIMVFNEYIRTHEGNVELALQRYNGSFYDQSRKYSKKIFNKMEVLYGITRKNELMFAQLKQADEELVSQI